MNVLITGAAGFIGYHTTREMIKRGYEIVAIDSLIRGRPERLKELKEKGAQTYIVDMREEEKIKEIIKREKVEAVVHLAALISVEESFQKPLLYNSINAGGTLSLLKASTEADVEKFIYISTAAVYGNPQYLPIDEEHPTRPLSPYGVSKLAGEEYLKMYQRTIGIKGIILRLFNVYGPGQTGAYAGVITKFIERTSRGEPPIIYGDGEQTRDFIHVKDVANAIIKALETNTTGTFNIASGKPTRIIDLAHMVISLTGLKLQPIFTEPRKGDIRHSYANIDKAREILKWEPKIDLKQGLKELIRYRLRQ